MLEGLLIVIFVYVVVVIFLLMFIDCKKIVKSCYWGLEGIIFFLIFGNWNNG